MALFEILAVGGATLFGVEAYLKRRQSPTLGKILQPVHPPVDGDHQVAEGAVHLNGVADSAFLGATRNTVHRIQATTVDPWLDEMGQTAMGEASVQAYTQAKTALTTAVQKIESALTVNAHPLQSNPEAESEAQCKARQARLRMRKIAQKNLPLVITMTGASAVGTILTIPLLNNVVGLAILGLSIPMLPVLYRDLRAGKVSIEHLATVVGIAAVGLGSVFAASLNLLVVLSRYVLLARIEDDSMNEMVDVFRQQPRTAWCLTDGVEVEVPLDKVKKGDLVVVTAGSIIPVDGQIMTGVATVDQHILTGESQPVEKQEGDPVFALTTVLSGRIEIGVERAGDETTAAQIGDILNRTIDVKTNMQLWSESLADRSVLPYMLVGGITAPFIGMDSSVAFLNTHPKYRSSVTTAFTLVNYLNLATQQGILVKDGRTLELLNGIDTVVFDKTGTLTEEQPHVAQVHITADLSPAMVLTLAAAAEQRQTHPIARAIVEAAVAQSLVLPIVNEATYKVGYGLTVMIEGQCIRVGSIRFIEMEGIAIPPTLTKIQRDCYGEGHSLILVAVDEQVAGAIELHATVRPEVARVIQSLRAHGIQTMYIISGDHEAPTRTLAATLGIDHYFAETLPENKADLIDEIQQMGRSVCYIGDGINDSIALKKAHISVSMRGASTVATDTANVVLMDGTLNHLPLLFELAHEYQGNMRQTYAMTLIPSLIGAGGALFFHWGLVTTILLNQVGLVLGVGNAMRPRLQKLLAME